MKEMLQGKRVIAMIMACLVLVLIAPASVDAATPSCSALYNAVKGKCSDGAKKVQLKASGKKSSETKRCTFVKSSYRKSVKDCYYATDSEQVYCVCIVRASSAATAKKIKKQFDATKKSNKESSYYYGNSTSKKVVSAAQAGIKGKYVWYISLAKTSGANKKAVKALQKKI